MGIPRASVPQEIGSTIGKLAELWRQSSQRPIVDSRVADHWRRLIHDWVDDARYPLLVRKSGARGTVVRHDSGRDLVPVDNAPANWVMSAALLGRCPSAADMFLALQRGVLPVGLALKSSERKTATYSGQQHKEMDPPNLNTLGWAVCHIEPIGLQTRSAIQSIPIDDLKSHVVRFLSIDNMFLVPKSHAGFGELPEVLHAFRAHVRGGELDDARTR